MIFDWCIMSHILMSTRQISPIRGSFRYHLTRYFSLWIRSRLSITRNLKISKQNNPNTDNNKMDPTQYFIIFDKLFFEYLFQKKAFKTKFLFNFPMPVIEISGLWKVLQPGLMTIKRSTSVFNFNFRKNMFTTNIRYVCWKNIQKYTEICSIKFFDQKILSMFTGDIWSSKI